jgi:hypothetical protein
MHFYIPGMVQSDTVRYSESNSSRIFEFHPVFVEIWGTRFSMFLFVYFVAVPTFVKLTINCAYGERSGSRSRDRELSLDQSVRGSSLQDFFSWPPNGYNDAPSSRPGRPAKVPVHALSFTESFPPQYSILLASFDHVDQ